ncbi:MULTISPECIES: thymidylate kinase [Salinivibrio]
MMTAEQLRALYHQKLLVEVMVEPSLDSEGWVVECRHTGGGIMALTDAEGIEQCFADIDQATLNALQIGFDQVRIAD